MVRDTEGTLSTASWDTRDRIIQAYYPRSGRRIKHAPMFDGANLKVHPGLAQVEHRGLGVRIGPFCPGAVKYSGVNRPGRRHFLVKMEKSIFSRY